MQKYFLEKSMKKTPKDRKMQKWNFTASLVLSIISDRLPLETAGKLLLEFLQGNWFLRKHREKGIPAPEIKAEGIYAN